MTKSKKNLIWIDLEMTGLDTTRDSILEIATMVTDSHLNVIAEGPSIAIYQPNAILEAMDEWNTRQHGTSGLIERVRESTINEAEAEKQTLLFLQDYVPAGVSPMCGNSICQDRRFMARMMPKLEAYFHYRAIDVSTIKDLARRWAPHIEQGFKKTSSHIAMDDVKDSIRELKYYRDNFIKLADTIHA